MDHIDFLQFARIFVSDSPDALSSALSNIAIDEELFIYVHRNMQSEDVFELVAEILLHERVVLVYSQMSLPRAFNAYRVIR